MGRRSSVPRRDRASTLPPAVVVGLDNITGLQTARILAARGVPVFGVVADRSHFGARTNTCHEIVTSELSGEPLIHSLQQLGARLGGTNVLIPCTDGSVATLSRCRSQLREWFTFPIASDEVVTTLMDKVRFAEHAQQAGLPFPRTECLANRADAGRVAASLKYPAVVKPPVKSVEWLSRTSAKGFRVADADALLAVYDRIRTWSPQLLVQEWVEGDESGLFSCNAYFDRTGRAQVTFVARKLRQWPPDVGTSASGEECRNDVVLTETLRLFEGVGFSGLAYLEMKRDARTGQLLIIEPNVGRPTGRSAIAEGGGVELVYTAYCDAAGLPLPANRTQRYLGTKWLDLRRDLQAAFVASRRGELSAREWFASIQGPKAHAIWARHDVNPFVVDVGQSLAEGLRRLVTRAFR